MNAPVFPKLRMNVDEFLAWSARRPETERYELVEGEIIAMTRDSVRHNRTKFATARTLDDAISAAGLPCMVFVDGVGVKTSDRTLRIPDVLVQCGAEPDPDALIVDSPTIVVEVVSPSSERNDTEEKLIDYFAVSSVRHYLIIASTQFAVVHHARDDHGTIGTRIVREGDIVLDPPGITVSVAALLGPAASAGAKES